MSTQGKASWDLKRRAHMEPQQGPSRPQAGPGRNQTGSDQTRLGINRSQTAQIEPRQSQMGPRCNIDSQVDLESAEPWQHWKEPESPEKTQQDTLKATLASRPSPAPKLQELSPRTPGPTPHQKVCSALTFNFQTIPNIHGEREVPLSLPTAAPEVRVAPGKAWGL